jgi:hypothetical protein
MQETEEWGAVGQKSATAGRALEAAVLSVDGGSNWDEDRLRSWVSTLVLQRGTVLRVWRQSQRRVTLCLL